MQKCYKRLREREVLRERIASHAISCQVQSARAGAKDREESGLLQVRVKCQEIKVRDEEEGSRDRVTWLRVTAAADARRESLEGSSERVPFMTQKPPTHCLRRRVTQSTEMLCERTLGE